MAKKPPPPRGSLPVLQYCTPDQLQIDATYQRSLETGQSQALIQRIVMGWDWDLCQPLVVSRRGDQGLFVVDGQHRLEAAKRRGDIAQLPCVVASYASAAAEAENFVKLNRQRTPLKALELFRAAVAGKDPEACKLMSLMHQAGLSLAPSSNNQSMKPGQVTNVSGLMAALRAWGEKPALQAMQILAGAWAGETLRYGGTIFQGIAAVVGERAKSDEWVSQALFTRLLGAIPQAEWYADIMRHKGENPNGSTRASAAAVIREAFAEAEWA